MMIFEQHKTSRHTHTVIFNEVWLLLILKKYNKNHQSIQSQELYSTTTYIVEGPPNNCFNRPIHTVLNFSSKYKNKILLL